MKQSNGNDLGITLAVIASISGAVGNLLFRLSWKAERWRKAIRFAGLCTVVAADPARILSFGFGNPAIVAPFSSLSLVWLILLANPIAGDKPNLTEVIGALVIASGVAVIAVFGASGNGGSDDRDDEFGIDDEGSSKDRLQDVITAFSSNGQRSAFIAYITLQVIFLLIAGGTVYTQSPKNLAAKVFWGGLGGVLQGNVYFLKAASTMAVLDFGGACTMGSFWILTISFIVIAATGLFINALAMRFYKATFCVCSFVGWYNVSAAAASAAFFGVHDISTTGLVLYLVGLGLIVGGVILLIFVSIGEALKDEEDSDTDQEDAQRPSSITEFISDNVIRPSLDRLNMETKDGDRFYTALAEDGSSISSRNGKSEAT